MQHNIANYLNQWQSEPDRVLYRQFTVALFKNCAAWQAAFRAAGLVAGDRVAICARNSVPWVQVDIAALGMGLVVVPLYVDDNAGNMAYCATHSGAKLLVLDAVRQAKQLLALGMPLPAMWILRCEADETLPENCWAASSQVVFCRVWF